MIDCHDFLQNLAMTQWQMLFSSLRGKAKVIYNLNIEWNLSMSFATFVGNFHQKYYKIAFKH
ncbi:hypothetical protein [Helicobacter sp.]|uniref:hypothetical protein n=1 Tax=Helicobacter sp. TaxID=218 RepID=UPI00199A6676|nr:hypothetical protein [Helicobacter sp.]MBD5164719.1 hypothetical protein [Helicobacter sp.]